MRKVLVVAGAAGLAAGGFAAVHGPAGATTAREAQSITLDVVRYYHAPTNSHRFRFSGSISSRVAEEYVAVMHQRCDQSFATAVAGAQTDASGFWRADASPTLFGGAGTFEARWKQQRSASVRVRPPIELTAVNLGKGKARVTVSTYDIQQDLKGRAVVLERLRNGTWSEVRRGKLARDAGGRLRVLALDVHLPRSRSDPARVRAGSHRCAVLRAGDDEEVEVVAAAG